MKHTAALSLLLLLSAGASQAATALRFTPPPGDASLKEFADKLGNNASEREQMLQAITTAKTEIFEQRYASKGWKNNVAGAYTFFVSGVSYVWTGKVPDGAAEDRLFAQMSQTLAPDLAGVSDREKATLYNTLIGSISLPLLLYIDAEQTGNQAQMEQARTLAAQYSREILKMEPEQVGRLLPAAPQAGPPAAAVAVAPATVSSAPAASGAGQLDGHWQCVVSSVRYVPGVGGSSMMMVDSIPSISFDIAGNRYRTSAGGGTLSVVGYELRFSGNDMKGMVGTLEGNTLVFDSITRCDRR